VALKADGGRGRAPPPPLEELTDIFHGILARPRGGPPPPPIIPNQGELYERAWEREQAIRPLRDFMIRGPQGFPERIPFPLLTGRNFWDWIQSKGYGIAPSYLPMAREVRPTVSIFGLRDMPSYSPSTRTMFAKRPYDVETWQHELGHHMDWMLHREFGGGPGFPMAVSRWQRDPEYPMGAAGGAFDLSDMCGIGPYGELYARAATMPISALPPYIQPFFPWRSGAVPRYYPVPSRWRLRR